MTRFRLQLLSCLSILLKTETCYTGDSHGNGVEARGPVKQAAHFTELFRVTETVCLLTFCRIIYRQWRCFKIIICKIKGNVYWFRFV